MSSCYVNLQPNQSGGFLPRALGLTLCIALIVMPFTAGDVILLPRCVTYCPESYKAVNQTSCRSVMGVGYNCPAPVLMDGTYYAFSLSGTTCTIEHFPKCELIVGPDCYYGDTAPLNSETGSCPLGFTYTGTGTTCYGTQGFTCHAGSYDPNSNRCTQPAQLCPAGYTMSGDSNQCESTVSIANVTLPHDCVSSATSQGECQWCNATNVCVHKNVTCPSSCATAPQEVCSLPPSWCHWCPQHNGRCKSLNGHGQWLSSWRREVECDTGSWSYSENRTASWSADHSESSTHMMSNTSSAPVTLSVSITTSHSSVTRSTPVSLSLSIKTNESSFTISRSECNSTSISTSTSVSGSPTASRSRSISSSRGTRTTSFTSASLVSLSHYASESIFVTGTRTVVASHSRFSASASSVTLQPSISATPKLCVCGGSIHDGRHLMLAEQSAHHSMMLDTLLAEHQHRTTGRTNVTVAVLSPLRHVTTPSEPDKAFIASAPLTRLMMWASRAMAMSLTLEGFWSVDATGRVVADGVETLCWHPTAATLRGTAFNVAAVRISLDFATDGTVTWVVLVTPASGDVNAAPAWLPPTVSPYSTVTLRLVMSLACEAGNPRVPGGALVAERSATILLPVAGIPQELAPEVRAASQASQLAAALVSAGGAGAAGRVLAMRAVVLCSSGEDASSVSAGPLGLVVGASWCSDADTVIPPSHRGTIVGNAILVAVACCGVSLFALAVWCRRGERTVSAALRLVAFPSSVYPVWVVVLPSTATATGQLVALTTGCVSDVLLVVAGLTIVAAPLGALWWLAYWAPSQGVSLMPVAHSSTRGACGWWEAAQWMRRVQHPSWEWVSVMPNRKHDGELPASGLPDDHVLQHFSVLLADHRLLWYAALDAAALAVVGALVAVSAHGPEAQCIAAGVLVTVLFGVQLVACAVLRPFTSLFGDVHGVFTLFFTFLAAVIQLSMFAVTGSSETADVLTRMSLAAAVCDLLTIGASFVTTLLNVYDVTCVLRSLLCSSGDDTDSGAIMCDSHAIDTSAPATFVPSLFMEDDGGNESPPNALDLEGFFWDADGRALSLMTCVGDGSLLNGGAKGRTRDLSLM